MAKRMKIAKALRNARKRDLSKIPAEKIGVENTETIYIYPRTFGAWWYAHSCSNPVPCGGTENEDTLRCTYTENPSPNDVNSNVYCDIHYEPIVYIPSLDDFYESLINFQGCKAPRDCGCVNSKRQGTVMVKPSDAPSKIFDSFYASLKCTWVFSQPYPKSGCWEDPAFGPQVFIVDILE